MMMKGGKKRNQGRKGPKKPALPLYFEPPRTRAAVLAFSGVYSAESESSAGGGHYHFFKINSAYDIDAAYGSVAVPGFAEYGAFFQNYRVISARVKLEAAVSGMTTGSICEVSPFQMAMVCRCPHRHKHGLCSTMPLLVPFAIPMKGPVDCCVLIKLSTWPSSLMSPRSNFVRILISLLV